MQELLDTALESFWHFMGVLIIMGLVIYGITNMWANFMRMIASKKNGKDPDIKDTFTD